MREHLYLDSSAIVKLVVLEPESTALQEFLRSRAVRVSSALAETEVPRALLRAGFGSTELRRAAAVLSRISLIDVDRPVLRAAGALGPPGLRSLDAIHLATALSLGEDLAGVVTYDARLSEAIAAVGLAVWTPA